MYEEDRPDVTTDDPWEPVNIATVLKSMPRLPAEIRMNLINSYGKIFDHQKIKYLTEFIY